MPQTPRAAFKGCPVLRPDAHPDGPKVIGSTTAASVTGDPGGAALLESDLHKIMAARTGTLADEEVKFFEAQPCCSFWPPAVPGIL